MPRVQSQSSPSHYSPAPSALIKSYALQLGFHKVGIVKAEALSSERERFSEWLHRGFHGEMKWLVRDPEQRTDPQKLLPGARSVVVVALNYYTPHEHLEKSGKVSRYAWGDDYHEVVGDKLRQLLSLIREQWPDAEGKVCVDIQPVMDKAWAARAGLGWIGKHTNLITEEYGSWIFIGELLLNLELEYDAEEIADQCGECTLCINACPTGAIAEPMCSIRVCVSLMPRSNHARRKSVTKWRENSKAGSTAVIFVRMSVPGTR